MDIKQTDYYMTLTAPLRAPELKRNVVFGAAGFSYTSDGMAFVLTRISKNHYDVQAIYAAKYEEYRFENVRTAVEFALKLVALDRSGRLAG